MAHGSCSSSSLELSIYSTAPVSTTHVVRMTFAAVAVVAQRLSLAAAVHRAASAWPPILGVRPPVHPRLSPPLRRLVPASGRAWLPAADSAI